MALSRHLSLDGQDYSEGDEFDVADAAAATWLGTGLVVPASGEWPDDLDGSTDPES